MAGLNEIMDQILNEARVSAENIANEAKGQADEIMAAAKKDAEKAVKEIEAKSASDVAAYAERIESNADLQKRSALLAAKQEIISGVIEKAYQKFCAQDGDSYLSVLKKMVSLFARSEQGEICFSEQDKQNLPTGFMDELNAAAAAKGGSLKLSDASVNIDKGFVLTYGGIEENCSFKALFDAKQNEIQDLINKEIFS